MLYPRLGSLHRLILSVLLSCLAACGPPARTPPQSNGPSAEAALPSPSARTVRLAYVSTATTFAPLWAAQEYGLLEQYGLHSDDLYYINGGPALMQALVAGDIDAAYSAFSSAVSAIMGGADLKVVAGFRRGFDHQLFTREGTGVRAAEDMKGKRAGVSRIGSESQVVVQLWARAHGLNSGDITYVNAGGAAERIAALEAGSADLVPLDPPVVVQAEKRGYLRIADLTQEAIPWQQDGLTVRTTTLQSDPALVKAIVQAVSEGAYLLRGDPERFRIVVSKYTRIEDPDALAAANAAFLRAWNRHGRPEPASVQGVQEVVSESMPGTAEEPMSRFVELSVLDALENEGVFDRLEQRYPPPPGL